MLTKAVLSINGHEETLRAGALESTLKIPAPVGAHLPVRVTFVNVRDLILELEALQVGCLVGAICVEFETSVAGEGVHRVESIVATFPSISVPTGV